MECYSHVNNAGGPKAAKFGPHLREPGFLFQLNFFKSMALEPSPENCHRRFLQDVSEDNNRSAYLISERAKRHDSTGSLRYIGRYFALRNCNMGMDYNP
jgi:hypothetical protein